MRPPSQKSVASLQNLEPSLGPGVPYYNLAPCERICLARLALINFLGSIHHFHLEYSRSPSGRRRKPRIRLVPFANFPPLSHQRRSPPSIVTYGLGRLSNETRPLPLPFQSARRPWMIHARTPTTRARNGTVRHSEERLPDRVAPFAGGYRRQRHERRRRPGRRPEHRTLK